MRGWWLCLVVIIALTGCRRQPSGSGDGDGTGEAQTAAEPEAEVASAFLAPSPDEVFAGMNFLLSEEPSWDRYVPQTRTEPTGTAQDDALRAGARIADLFAALRAENAELAAALVDEVEAFAERLSVPDEVTASSQELREAIVASDWQRARQLTSRVYTELRSATGASDDLGRLEPLAVSGAFLQVLYIGTSHAADAADEQVLPLFEQAQLAATLAERCGDVDSPTPLAEQSCALVATVAQRLAAAESSPDGVTLAAVGELRQLTTPVTEQLR